MKEIKISGIDETVYYGTCDNGLDIYVWVDKNVDTVYSSLAVKYGSVHTNFEVNEVKCVVPDGTAHFLEHVKFNEESGVTAHDFYYKTGAEVNAFTTFDFTSYYVVCNDNVEKNLIHLLDFVQNPYFTKELVEKEKGIICEEEKMGEDNPNVINYFGIFKNLFHESKYRNLVTGDIENIKKTTLKDLALVFDTFYHPENMALFVTGNVNPHEIKMLVNDNQRKKVFEEFKNPKIINKNEKDSVLKECEIITGNVAESKVKLGVKIPREVFSKFSDFEVRLAINLILSMNFGSTSDLRDYLINNNIATNLSASCDIYDKHVIIVVGSETRFTDDVIKMIKDKLNNLVLDESTFNRKIKALIGTFILNYDDVERVNSLMQDDYINYSNLIYDAKEKYESLTIKKVKSISRLLNFDNTTIFIMNPKDEKK